MNFDCIGPVSGKQWYMPLEMDPNSSWLKILSITFSLAHHNIYFKVFFRSISFPQNKKYGEFLKTIFVKSYLSSYQLGFTIFLN
jgi:hypothetical protein